MKIIALEEHFLSPAVRNAWAAAAEAGQDTSEIFNAGEMQAKLEDLGSERLAKMNASGVDIQVLSLTSPGLHNLGPEEAATLARSTNGLIAATIASHPGRFEGFATIPVTAPKQAAAELERCVRDLGFKGGMLFGRAKEKNLDHADFLPIFEMASNLRCPLYLHPQVAPHAVREAYYSGFGTEVDLAFAAFGIGWHYDCGVQFLRLALAGHFDRFPDLQIVLGHWGEVVLFYAERLKAFSRVTQLQRPVFEVMRENLYVTPSGMFSDNYFRHATEVVGIDRVMFSTDYPYQYAPGGGARRFLEQLPVSAEDRRKIAHENWEKLIHGIRR